MNSALKQSITRRQFLRSTGVLGLGTPLFTQSLAAAGSKDSTMAPEPSNLPSRTLNSTGNKVIIIGAGLAGLASATELRKAGHEVTVLEARARPGGRVHSVSDPFADNLTSELGAVVFSEAYKAANHYIDQFGLKRLDFAFPDLPALYHSGGRRFSVAPGVNVDWPYDLSQEESELGPIGITLKYLAQVLPGDIDNPDTWNRPAVRKLDKISLADFLRQQGASEGAIKLVGDALYFGWDSENASTLSIAVTDIGLFFRGAKMFVLEGGNAALPKAMAAFLHRHIQYGVEVSDIHLLDDKLMVTALKRGKQIEYSADHIVCTLPLPVMKNLAITPRLPGQKQIAIDNLPYHDIVRAQFQVDSSFWREENVSGSATTDLFGGRLDRQPYHSIGSVDQRAILDALFIGKDAARLGQMSDEDVVSFAAEKIAEIHPDFPKHDEGGIVKKWVTDPHTLGGWSWADPGYVTNHLENLQWPFRRMHFAGEHTSMLRATMEGALRSGIRAAKEIDDALL